MRQWVLSLPVSLRYRIAYDGALLTPILDAFIRAVCASLRRRARERYQARRPQCGAVTFVQRFGGAINLNVHFHTLAFDGVYAVDHEAGTIEFLRLPAPGTKEVSRVLADAAGRIAKCLNRRGLGDDADPEAADPLAQRDPLLARLYAASAQGRVSDGERAGQRTTRVGSPTELPPTDSSRGAVGGGMSLHAGVYVPATDRRRLERLCRYMARPALATERLERLADGRIAYRLRHPWRDGTTGLIFEPREFIARLATLIPPPRANQLRYHGILAPAAAWRDKVVPAPESEREDSPAVPRKHSPSWATLLKRVFAFDALRCPRCAGQMRVLAAITDERTIARFSIYLRGTRAPPADG